MSHINNYVPGKFSQFNLDDGSKILVSVGTNDIKVFLLGWFNMPKRILYTFDENSFNRIYHIYQNILEFVGSQILIASTVDEVVNNCRSIDDSLKEIYNK
jgi:hypothetical protein